MKLWSASLVVYRGECGHYSCVFLGNTCAGSNAEGTLIHYWRNMRRPKRYLCTFERWCPAIAPSKKFSYLLEALKIYNKIKSKKYSRTKDLLIVKHRCGLIGKLLWVIGKLKKDSAAYTQHCSGEGREKRERKSLCGGSHITSLLCQRGKKKGFDSFL